MACGKNDRSKILFVCYTANDLITIDNQLSHLALKVYLATRLDYRITHGLNHLGEPVCSYMGMGISQDSRRRPMLAEDIQDLVRITTFLTTGVELAIRIGACPTLTKTVVALCIYLLVFGDIGQIFLSFMNILSSLQHDRPQTQFYQSQRSKQSTRPRPHDNHLRPAFHIRVFRPDILIVMGLFIDIDSDLQVDEYLSLTGINASFEDPHPINRPFVDALLIRQPPLQPILLCCHLRRYPYLIFVRHETVIYIIIGVTSQTFS